MSERKLRKLAKDILRDAYIGHHYAILVRQALADPPDVVKVLRWLTDHFYQDNQMARDYIHDEFHVRLTNDGGWEWTEEGKDATH